MSNNFRNEILDLVRRYHKKEFGESSFVPGKSPVPVSGRVFDADDLVNLVDSSLDFWLTSGRYANLFEKNFSNYLGMRHAILCNSGSSANLLALSALTSPQLKDRRLIPGDEVVTIAASFPTTVNPIIQNNLTPVFVDIELGTYNVNPQLLEKAISSKTKALMLAHTLGNPFDLDAVKSITKKHNLWLIEDSCDALGSTYKGKKTGTFGDLATFSFYPAHHITMGEGGAVVTNNPKLEKLLESFRDWGRDCWCEPGKDNTCGKRYEWQLGNLPQGYDHKYIYSHVGYNLKLTDMQAAVGVSQLRKINEFIDKRKRNWNLLYKGLMPFEEFLYLPELTQGSDPSWFGFLITVKADAPFSRRDLLLYLNKRSIGTRLLFGGNIIKQPAYNETNYRVSGELNNTNIVMMQSFWIGVYPGLSEKMIEYIIDEISNFIINQ